MGVLVDSSFLHTPKRVPSQSWAPVPEVLLAAITGNDAASFHAHLLQLCHDVDCFWVWTDPKSGNVVIRTLCMIAAFHSSTDVLALLLSLGADVTLQSPDDATTALHCACSNPSSSSTCAALRLLINAGAALDVLDKHNRTARDLLSLQAVQAGPQEDQGPRDSFETTDEFRMFRHKVELCGRLDEQHDWTSCPFMHPGEKARRRDPRTHKYDGVPCPDFRKGSCKRGDACTFAHGVFECWLHPARYRTQLCKEGALCKRGVCFFAHSMEELREPLHLHGEKPESPDSPKGPLTPGEASTASLDTSSGTSPSSRASSPEPSAAGATSSGSVSGGGSTRDSASSALRTPVAAAGLSMGGGSGSSGRGGGRREHSKLRGSAESMRSVLSRAHSMGSAESSLSSTPVLEGALSASLSSSGLARSLSGLSLAREETVAAAAAAAAAAVAALGVGGPGATAPGWGLQMHPGDMLSFQMAAAGLLGGGGFQGVLPDQAAVLQAAALQQRLAMAQGQVPLDSTAALLAAAGLRRPLANLSLNMAAPQPGPATPYPSCFGI